MKSLAGLLLALLVLFGTVPAGAVGIEIARPEAALEGTTTKLTVEVQDAQGNVEVRWDFGDGTELDFAEGQTSVEHEYASAGHYAIIVVVRDEAGFTSGSFVHTVHRPLSERAGRSSSSLAYDPARHLLVVANSDNDTVSVIDTVTLTKLHEIPVYDEPESLAFLADGTLWVLHREDYVVAMIDVERGEIIGRARLPYASQPVAMVVSPDEDAVYVTLMATGELLRLDPGDASIAGRVRVSPFARGVAISGDGKNVYVTRFVSPEAGGEVTRVRAGDMLDQQVIVLAEDTTTMDTDQTGRGLPNYLFSVALSPDGREAWVPGKKDNMARGLFRDGLGLTQDNTVRPMIGMIDLTSEEEDVESRMDLDDRNLPAHVTFSPLGDYAFVSVLGSSLVEVRDVYDRSFVTALRGTGLAPSASLLDEAGRLFVHAKLSRNIAVFDVSGILSGEDQITKKLTDIPLVESETLSERVLRGKRIFYDSEDKRMTQEGYISCASCHFEGFEDGRVWDFSDRGEGFRNTTSLLGRSGLEQGPVHWSGNFDEIQDFEGAIRGNFGGTGFLDDALWEEGTRSDPLGDRKEGLSDDLDALALYVSSLDAIPRSPFRNEDGSLTEAAERGAILFEEAGCGSCHSGATFTDSADGLRHDVGTLKETSGSRLGQTLDGLDTPTLLGVWQTAPYLHDGSAKTLFEVLTTYNPEDQHGNTSAFGEAELSDLVAYLQQLDGRSAPTSLPPLANGTGKNRTADRGCSLVARPASSSTWVLFALLLAFFRASRRRQMTS